MQWIYVLRCEDIIEIAQEIASKFNPTAINPGTYSYKVTPRNKENQADIEKYLVEHSISYNKHNEVRSE